MASQNAPLLAITVLKSVPSEIIRTQRTLLTIWRTGYALANSYNEKPLVSILSSGAFLPRTCAKFIWEIDFFVIVLGWKMIWFSLASEVTNCNTFTIQPLSCCWCYRDADTHYSECGPSLGLVRNIGSHIPPVTCWIIICILTKSPGVSYAQESLRSIARNNLNLMWSLQSWWLALHSLYYRPSYSVLFKPLLVSSSIRSLATSMPGLYHPGPGILRKAKSSTFPCWPCLVVTAIVPHWFCFHYATGADRSNCHSVSDAYQDIYGCSFSKTWSVPSFKWQ